MRKTWWKNRSNSDMGFNRPVRRSTASLGISVLSAFIFMTVFSGAVQAKSLMLGHTVPPTHVWHKVATKFSENLAAASQDRMKIQVTPLSKLGNEPQMFSMVQSDAIAFSILPVGFLSNREESLLGWFLPYQFLDVKEAGAVASVPAAKQMLKNLEPHGVIGLGYMFAGMQHILSMKAVVKPDDLVNKKVRSFPSPIFNDWLLGLGAAPTALPLAEVAPSLSTNLLDAAAVDLDIIVGLKYHQQAKFLALTNHMAFPAILITSKKWWDGLPQADKDMIQKAYAEAEKFGLDSQIAAEIANLEKLKQDGVTVTQIDMAAFKEKAMSVKENYIAKNPLIKQFANEVEGVLKK
ncbi:MAG: TRAP transporter substrate-binding protein [Desulfatirhabdiaceae bacterium]